MKDDVDFLLVQVAETHESLRSTSRCGGSSFWLQISRVDPSFWAQTSHLLLFLLAPSATAPRGVPAVPWMWRPAVALQFREARPVTGISLRETRLFEAKPSFLAFCHQMSSFHQALDAFFFLAFNSAWPQLRTNFARILPLRISTIIMSKEDSRISQHDPLFFSPLGRQEFNPQHAWI